MEAVIEGAETPTYTAVVIDDAYDRQARWEEVPPSELSDLWQEAGFDLNPEALRNLGIVAEESDDMEPSDLEILWHQRGSLSPAQSSFVEAALGQFAPGPGLDLRALTEAIREHLGCDPDTKGTTPPHLEGEVDFVFLDHRLGPDSDPEESEKAKRHSLEVASEVLRVAKDSDNRPIVVLMSSRDPDEDEKRQFREKLELAEDAFYFIPKREFEDVHMLFLRLSALKQRRALGDGAQRFAEKIASAVENAAGSLSKAFYGLRAEDYVLTHALSLRDQGEPLGDYMLWLFGSFVKKELFERNEDVKAAREHLAEMEFRDLLPFYLAPSSSLQDMYDAALYADADVAELGGAFAEVPHGKGTRWRKVANAPLMLGHVFRSGKSDVWAVMNAACDLAARPVEEGKIEGKLFLPKPSLSVVLMHGHLVPVDKPTAHKGARTDLFKENDRAHWIMWNVTRVDTVLYRNMDQWARKSNARLVKRLRPEYALHLQREFTSAIMRVGLPVSPPIPQRTQGALYVRGEDGTCERIRTLSNPVGFVRVDRRDKTDRAEWTCTIKVAAELLGSLSGAIEKVVANKVAAEAGGENRREVVRALNRDLGILRDARASLPEVMATAQRSYLGPPGSVTHLQGTPLAISAGYPTDAAFPENKKCALLLNIETDQATYDAEGP